MCQDDSCDLLHCKHCKQHTIGNTLYHSGLCFDCALIEQDEENRRQHDAYLRQIAKDTLPRQYK